MMNIGMIINMLFWIIVIGFAIYGFVLLIMKPFEKGDFNKRNTKENENALEILSERFAKGDINEEEYEQKKKVLKK